MAQPLTHPLPDYPSRVRRRSRRSRFYTSNNKKTNTATLASTLQLQEEKRGLIYSYIALGMKFGFFLIAISSLFNLGIAAQHRIRRNNELSTLLDLESKKFQDLHLRFDKLFTIGGSERLMDEQDQWIAPNSIRVIWR